VDDGKELEVLAGSLLKGVAGLVYDQIPAGDAVRFDMSDREVFFELGGRRLRATWEQFHNVGDCHEI
jgi:hypothetical protein